MKNGFSRPMVRAIKAGARRLGLDIRRIGTRKPPSDRMFEQWLAYLRRQVPVATVFDVGANRGQTINVFRPCMPDAAIYAFEPFGPPFAELEKLARADRRLRVFNTALGDADGVATLYQNNVEDTNSLLHNSPGADRFAPDSWMTPIGRTEVAVARLDRVFRELSLERIDVLKVDAQGYERRILEGAGALLDGKAIRGVMLEILFVPYYEGQAWGGELIEFLRGKGYRLFGLSCVQYDLDYGWHWADAMFVPDDGTHARPQRR